MVCSSRELAKALLLNTLPSHMIVLTLSNNSMSEMENGSFSGLLPVKTPMAHAAPRGHVDVRGPCYSWGTVCMLMSTVHDATKGQEDNHGLCYHWRIC